MLKARETLSINWRFGDAVAVGELVLRLRFGKKSRRFSPHFKVSSVVEMAERQMLKIVQKVVLNDSSCIPYAAYLPNSLTASLDANLECLVYLLFCCSW